MRKITREIVFAFEHGITLKIDNSRTDGRSLWLYDNKIAERRADGLWITNAGWQSMTTKERLNGLRGVSIQSKRGEWYLNGLAWDGEWVHVESHRVGVVPEPEFDITSEWTEGYNRPIYSVFHTWDALDLPEVEHFLSGKGINHRRMESDTEGVYRPNYFIVVMPSDYEKAKRFTDEF